MRFTPSAIRNRRRRRGRQSSVHEIWRSNAWMWVTKALVSPRVPISILPRVKCKRARRRPAVRGHPQWCLLCCHEANTRQSGRLCAIHDMWTRGPELGLRWILPQAATCPVCKHESIPLLSSQGHARGRTQSSAGRPISRFQMSN